MFDLQNGLALILILLPQTHLQICGCKIIQCRNPHCHLTMERRLIDDHVRNSCHWRTVHCGYCDMEHAKCDEEVSGSCVVKF